MARTLLSRRSMWSPAYQQPLQPWNPAGLPYGGGGLETSAFQEILGAIISAFISSMMQRAAGASQLGAMMGGCQCRGLPLYNNSPINPAMLDLFQRMPQFNPRMLPPQYSQIPPQNGYRA